MDRRFLPIALLSFVNVLGFAIFIPVLPFIVERFGGGEMLYGLLIAVYPFCQFFATPILGGLSDRYGRRPLLMLSQAGTLASWVIFGSAFFVPVVAVLGNITLPLLIFILSRVVDGITGGNNSIAVAYVSDITDHNNKTKMFGMLGAIGGAGLILGPAIGSAAASSPAGYLGIVAVGLVISLVTLLLIVFATPESLVLSRRSKYIKFNFTKEINIFARARKFIPNRNLMKLFFIRVFFALAFASYSVTVVLFLKNNMELTTLQIGILFLVIGSFFIFNQLVVVKELARRIGDLKTFYTGQALMIAGFALVPFIRNIPFFLLVSYITNLGISASFPTFKSLVTNQVDETKQGEVTGLDESVLSAASAVSPIVATALYTVMSASVFVIFAAIMILPHIYVRLRTGKFMIRMNKNHKMLNA